MKAITYSRYGPPDVLQLRDVEKPKAMDDEVLIRVRAAEATKSDCEMRSFKYSVKWFWLPLLFCLFRIYISIIFSTNHKTYSIFSI